MAPGPLGATSHRGAQLVPALARTVSATVTAAPRPMPGTTMTWLLIASMAAVTQRHTPRPVPWYPAQTRTVTPDAELRRHPCHSALRNAAAHGSARLYTHRLGDHDGGPSTTAVNDYDIAVPSRNTFDHFGPFLQGPGPALAATCPPQLGPRGTRPGLSRDKPLLLHLYWALRAPTPDSDVTRFTRSHVTPRYTARPGLTCTHSSTVTATLRFCRTRLRHGLPCLHSFEHSSQPQRGRTWADASHSAPIGPAALLEQAVR
jgi:hypothetical protein